MGVISFISKKQTSANVALQDWIRFAQEHHALGPNFEWDKHVWDITHVIQKRGFGGAHTRLHFTNNRSTKNTKNKKGEALSSPFLEFSKAYISEELRRHRLKEYNKLLGALRVLEQAAVNDGCLDISLLTPRIFDAAATLLGVRYKDPWDIGLRLQNIAKFLDKEGFVFHSLQWMSPFRYRRPERSDKVSVDNDSWRQSKLPEMGAIFALAEINHSSKNPIDLAITSWAALALYAPSRCAEILTLPQKCWSTLGDGTPVLRWQPAKGGESMVKPSLGSESLELARQAVSYIEKQGEASRTAAKWYFENPSQLYLPPGTEYLRGQDLTVVEIGMIVGGEITIQTLLASWKFKSCGKTTDKERRGKGTWAALFRFSDLEKFVLDSLPPTFPWHDRESNLYMHEALFIFPRNFFRPGVTVFLHLPESLSISMVNHQLGSNPGGRTIFSRNEKIGPDGEYWTLTTHQFRHLLNTLAQAKYISGQLIAFWSGRANASQNSFYDHTDPQIHIEAFLHLQKSADEISLLGPLQARVNARKLQSPVSARDVLKEEIGALHVTKYGLCRHNYALTPCPKQKDCVSCGENVFVKGDPKNLKEARRTVDILSMAVKNATEALRQGEAGAERWLDLNSPRLERWKEVLRIHHDDSISNGTICSLPTNHSTQSSVGFSLAMHDEALIAENTEEMKRLGVNT